MNHPRFNVNQVVATEAFGECKVVAVYQDLANTASFVYEVHPLDDVGDNTWFIPEHDADIAL